MGNGDDWSTSPWKTLKSTSGYHSCIGLHNVVLREEAHQIEDWEEVGGNNDNDCQAGQPENTSGQRKRDEHNHQQNVAKGENTTCYLFVKAETNYFKMSLLSLATSTAWKERLVLRLIHFAVLTWTCIFLHLLWIRVMCQQSYFKHPANPASNYLSLTLDILQIKLVATLPSYTVKVDDNIGAILYPTCRGVAMGQARQAIAWGPVFWGAPDSYHLNNRKCHY